MGRHPLYTGLTALASLASSQSLPYNPSNVFLLPDSNIAYIFRPSSHAATQAQLLSFDYSRAFTTVASSFETVSESLPFLSEVKSLAYTPTIGADGNITALAGDCTLGVDAMQAWVFKPEDGRSDGRGSWSQVDTTNRGVGSHDTAAGSNYLASAASFAPFVNATDEDTTLYTFGGMCPQTGSTADTWQKEADYSNLMLQVSKARSEAGATTYGITTLENRGPPIPQAGATVTGLRIAYSSSGNGQQSQQQDFVLLGGHTQAAFINTSQVAVFSLPQASWSFMPVQQPSRARTDLAVRRRQDISEVTPRSGHTAVLSERGDSIVLFGGWVGNVDTPASPQLAILDMGTGGDWSWRVPADSGSGLAADTGIYGHGAAILPGNVMMVVGGYTNGVPTSRRLRRDVQTTHEGVLFYNITSGAWLETYNPPVEDQSSHGPLSRTSERVGLGTGLGFGAALLVSVVVFYFWYSRRLKRAREERQHTLLAHSSDGSFDQSNQAFLNGGGFDGRGGDEAAVGRFWPTGGAAGSHPKPPEMQHTTGTFVNVPSPTRGLRKGLAGRNYQYHAAPRYDEQRISHASGNIHPIAEQANEDEDGEEERRSASDELTEAERKLRDLERVLMSEDDPFADQQPNPLGSHPVSPLAPSNATVMRVPTGASRTPNRTTHRRPLSEEVEVSNWTIERDPEDLPQQNDHGRASPTKSSSDERTSSTLSERSTRTTISESSITTTMSTRTGALLAAAAAVYRAQNGTPPTEERTRTMSSNGGRKSPYYFTRGRSSTAGSANAVARNSIAGDADSFATARSRSNFVDLQSEGEALLGGRPTMDRDDPYQRAVAAQGHNNPPAQPVSTSFGSMQQRRKPGLMGSLRRAINAVSTVGERSFSLTSSAEQYGFDPQNSSSSSPTREPQRQIGSVPRRAVSDGGALLKQKRGQKDWQDDTVFPPYHDDPDPNDWGLPRSSLEKQQAEEEWDVEGEAVKRDVQVMFTVPKSRLRVVNDDMDRASLRSASDGVVSRHNSIKDLRREGSMKTLGARSEGDKALLPSTEEVVEDSEKEKAA